MARFRTVNEGTRYEYGVLDIDWPPDLKEWSLQYDWQGPMSRAKPLVYLDHNGLLTIRIRRPK